MNHKSPGAAFQRKGAATKSHSGAWNEVILTARKKTLSESFSRFLPAPIQNKVIHIKIKRENKAGLAY